MTTVLRSRARAVSGIASAVLLFAAAAPACSSDDPAPVQDTTPPPCDSTKCYPGNTCLPLNGVVECRKTCSSNIDPKQNCPFGYTCVDSGASSPFCVKDNVTLTKATKGQWGSPCAPTGGLVENADCDVQQGFACYGLSPTDADAYCTLFGCATDRDCGAGFYCGDANVAPNVENPNRSLGETQRVCLRRDYCAPCAVDLDCPPLDGVTQHCLPGDDGAGFCSPECETNKNCNKEARCVEMIGLEDAEGNTVKACYPRAGTCVGDGNLCSPCRSDKDCGEDGACVKGEFTTEKSCAKLSAIPCTYKQGSGQVAGKDYQCPTVDSPAGTQVGCYGKYVFKTVPKSYCHGIYSFGESADVGCWTPAKK